MSETITKTSESDAVLSSTVSSGIGAVKACALSLGKAAKQSATILAKASTSHKNDALLAIAGFLEQDKDKILSANARDIKQAESDHLDKAMLDRLGLSVKNFEQMLHGPAVKQSSGTATTT